MKIKFVAAMAALVISGTATAQEVNTADPIRLELARQLMAASGGSELAEQMLKQTYGSMDEMLSKAIPSDKAGVFRSIQQDLASESIKMIPILIEQSVVIYARNLTEKELRDMLAFQTSESGQSITRKLPHIMQETIRAQVPYMQAMMPRVLQRAMDKACDEAQCNAAERQEVAKIVAKAMSQNPS